MHNLRHIDPATPSLLWLSVQDSHAEAPTDLNLVADLRVKVIADAISPHPNYSPFILKTLLTLITDYDTICYRHDVLADCMNHPDFVQELENLLPMIRGMHEYVSDIRVRRNEISIVLSRLTELENYVEAVQRLHAILQRYRDQIQATGWHRLRQQVEAIINDPQFDQLAQELPPLRETVREIVSVTVGINLSPDLKPIGATLLSINKRPFKGPRFFRKLWGTDDDDERGISRLREMPQPLHFRADGIMQDRHETMDRLAANAMFNDLAKLLDDIIRPIGNALQKYTRINSSFLRYIEPEIAFYAGAFKLTRKLQAHGLPMTRPAILPPSDRRLNASNVYNLDLALRLLQEHKGEDISKKIVGNDVRFDEDGRILVLTGPNRGGKTTFTQSIGLLHILAQSGLMVPADAVEISPVDAIYLHFPAEENPTMESGRLGEEAKRLREIFKVATRHSLILLNESLASTSATESYFLARDIVSCLRMLGTRAVFVTHLHELADDVSEINSELAGDSLVQSIISVVEADSEGAHRTYKIVPAPPHGQSYAREIAKQYGISLEQIQALFNERNLLD